MRKRSKKYYDDHRRNLKGNNMTADHINFILNNDIVRLHALEDARPHVSKWRLTDADRAACLSNIDNEIAYLHQNISFTIEYDKTHPRGKL